MTAQAKWMINCVAETRGRYGKGVVLNTLRGANMARLRELAGQNGSYAWRFLQEEAGSERDK